MLEELISDIDLIIINTEGNKMRVLFYTATAVVAMLSGHAEAAK